MIRKSASCEFICGSLPSVTRCDRLIAPVLHTARRVSASVDAAESIRTGRKRFCEPGRFPNIPRAASTVTSAYQI